MVVELLGIGGIGLAAGGWLLSRRAQLPTGSGIDPVFIPCTGAPLGCAVAADEREGAVANEPRDGDASCGVHNNDRDVEADCGDDSSDGGSDGGGDSSSD